MGWGACKRALKLRLSRKGLSGPRPKPESGNPTFRDCRGGPRKRDFVFHDEVRTPRLYPDPVQVTRLRRSLMRLQDQMRRMRHLSIREQANILNPMLRGHYAYYGIAGNIRALQRVHRAVERYWRIMLSSRTWKGQVFWKQSQQIKERFPLVRPKLYLPYSELQAIAVL
jgi:hypothetical protein